MKTTYVLAAVALFSMAGQAIAQESPVDLGKKVFARCAACHAVGPNAANRVGPQLNGIIGRLPASVPGYAYSAAAVANAVGKEGWTVDRIKKYIANPTEYLGGTSKMARQNIKDEDFPNLIAYLSSFKADGSPAQ